MNRGEDEPDRLFKALKKKEPRCTDIMGALAARSRHMAVLLKLW